MRHQKGVHKVPQNPLADSVGLSIAHIRSIPSFEYLTEEEANRICMLLKLIVVAIASVQSRGYSDEPLVATLTIPELKEIIIQCISETLPPPVIIPVEESLLKRKEVAKMLRISLVTLNQWMREGRIPYHRIHSRIYFKASEVRKALNNQDYKP